MDLRLLVGLAVALGLGAQQQEQVAQTPAGLPATLAGFQDEGVFHLYLNEERVGTTDFRWQPDGNFRASSTLSMAGQSVQTGITITPDSEGRWAAVRVDTPQGPLLLSREGSAARRTFRDQTTTFTTRTGAALFSNDAPALVSQSIRLYDRAKGGRQTLPILILPAAGANVAIELKDQVDRSVAGRDLSFTRFAYELPGAAATVWADNEARIYLIEISAQHAVFVREGYESLRTARAIDPLLSAPTHEVRLERNVRVPMRDRVTLATDVYRPARDGRYPVILVRTPYKKEMLELQGRYFARRGYTVAIQDCRGRFESGGVWEPFVNEPKDGYDSVEWLARQSWSNGKVGMIGGSYLGWVQWWAASQHPPHLVTIIPNVAPPDPFYNIPYEYGAFFLTGAIWWADILETAATADLSGVAFSRVSEKKYDTLLKHLPVVELDKIVLGKENPYWRKWIAHPTNDAYWQQASHLDRLKDVRIPVFHQSGWFDGDGIGSKLNYLKMVSHGHPYQKLVLGPWGHTDKATRLMGDRDFGPDALIDLQRDYLRWFDHWLKGVDNGIVKEPLVSIFVMGANKWLHGPVYPLPATRPTRIYLAGGGKLTLDPPAADEAPDRYTYDPGDPTPDPEFYQESDDEKRKVLSAAERRKVAEAHHDKVIASRRDILVYSTEPLAKPLTFAGPISAVLYASSSARDTDWFMTLYEVNARGRYLRLAQGKIRARFRRSTKKPEPLKPGEIYEYTLDLWQSGITIPTGSKLRVEVASAAFPIFSRNLNTGGHNEMETRHLPAEQAVYHSSRFPSHVLLPVIPE